MLWTPHLPEESRSGQEQSPPQLFSVSLSGEHDTWSAHLTEHFQGRSENKETQNHGDKPQARHRIRICSAAAGRSASAQQGDCSGQGRRGLHCGQKSHRGDTHLHVTLQDSLQFMRDTSCEGSGFLSTVYSIFP